MAATSAMAGWLVTAAVAVLLLAAFRSLVSGGTFLPFSALRLVVRISHFHLPEESLTGP
jgi:hypothetical protein